jgi:hypothetical protein
LGPELARASAGEPGWFPKLDSGAGCRPPWQQQLFGAREHSAIRTKSRAGNKVASVAAICTIAGLAIDTSKPLLVVCALPPAPRGWPGSTPLSRAMGRNTVDPCIGAAGSFEPGLLYTKPSTPNPRTRVGGAAPAEARGEFLAPNSPLVRVCAPWCWLCGAPPAAAVTSRRCPVKKQL